MLRLRTSRHLNSSCGVLEGPSEVALRARELIHSVSVYLPATSVLLWTFIYPVLLSTETQKQDIFR
jgi:hypothetical protein